MAIFGLHCSRLGKNSKKLQTVDNFSIGDPKQPTHARSCVRLYLQPPGTPSSCNHGEYKGKQEHAYASVRGSPALKLSRNSNAPCQRRPPGRRHKPLLAVNMRDPPKMQYRTVSFCTPVQKLRKVVMVLSVKKLYTKNAKAYMRIPPSKHSNVLNDPCTWST